MKTADSKREYWKFPKIESPFHQPMEFEIIIQDGLYRKVASLVLNGKIIGQLEREHSPFEEV